MGRLSQMLFIKTRSYSSFFVTAGLLLVISAGLHLVLRKRKTGQEKAVPASVLSFFDLENPFVFFVFLYSPSMTPLLQRRIDFMDGKYLFLDMGNDPPSFREGFLFHFSFC